MNAVLRKIGEAVFFLLDTAVVSIFCCSVAFVQPDYGGIPLWCFLLLLAGYMLIHLFPGFQGPAFPKTAAHLLPGRSLPESVFDNFSGLGPVSYLVVDRTHDCPLAAGADGFFLFFYGSNAFLERYPACICRVCPAGRPGPCRRHGLRHDSCRQSDRSAFHHPYGVQ